MSEQQAVAQETNSAVPQDPPPLPSPPPPSNILPNISAESFKGFPEHHMYKNRLQEYTQKSSIQLPVYQTINEGAQHAPRFRSTVLVDGTSYTSPNTFPHRKTAEQDAARVALTNINQKMKADGCPLIREDTTFCKSILNEYAVKKRMEKPTYHTVQPEGLLPVFISSLVFNGVTYTGETGRNKKEAEQLAARAAILSIIDSESGEMISEIIKSKSKLYAALNKSRHSNSIQHAAIPVVETGVISCVQTNKRKEPEVPKIDINMPATAISESSLDEPAKIQAVPALHEFKMPKPELPYEGIDPPIEFVPAEFPQPVLPSTSGVKRNRRNKKKAKKGLPIDSQMPVAAVPLHQIPPCSVAQ